MLPVFLLLVALQNLEAAETIISVTNGLDYGDWGVMEVCDKGTMATGLQLKVQEDQGHYRDDSAVNAIAIFCTILGSRQVQKTIKSTEGIRGSWKSVKWCNSGYIKKFILRVQPESHMGNTAVNNIKIQCSDGSIIEGDGLTWGSYGEWSPECPSGVNGLQSRVQTDQGMMGDDVGLSNLKLQCST